MEAPEFSATVSLDIEHLTSILSTEPRLDQANLPPAAVDQRIYTPLQDARRQIRLLTWRPDLDPTGMHDLQTSVWDLDKAPAYVAISYTWGPTVNRPIVIDGISTSVRHNAHYALWQVRPLQPHCHVWIDSICINQQDDEEKSAQVASIFDIFKRALQVVACLGEHAEDSDFLFATAKAQEPHLLALRARGPTFLGWIVSKNYEQFSKVVKLDRPAYQRFISACLRLCSRAYWQRLWVVQELAAAREGVLFACGVHTLGSKLLYNVWTILWKATARARLNEALELGYDPSKINIHTMHSNMRAILIKALSQPHKRSRQSLGTELHSSVFMLCADVRDRLFGILTTTNWSFTGCAPITPDYTKSAWELAVMLTRILKVSDLQIGLLALEIDHCHEGIRAVLQNQRNARMPEFEDVDEPCVPLKHEEVTMSANCARLYYTGDESLTADLRRHGSRRYDIEKTAEACSECAAHKARETVLCDHGQKKLYVDGVLAALLCPEAMPGDILIHCRKFSSALSSFHVCTEHYAGLGWSTVVLVVRPKYNDILDIVGQGVLTASFYIHDECYPMPEYDPKHAWPCQESEHRRFWADVSLRLTAEELMLWVAQDLQRAEVGPFSFPFLQRYNTDARLKRLLTPPCARPRGAVRICKASCCHCHVSQEKLSGSIKNKSRD